MKLSSMHIVTKTSWVSNNLHQNCRVKNELDFYVENFFLILSLLFYIKYLKKLHLIILYKKKKKMYALNKSALLYLKLLHYSCSILVWFMNRVITKILC